MYTNAIRENFLAILAEELVPAMGCTEPIALAYAAARGRQVLGADPEAIVARCSGNMIKNVRCVRIPNSRGMTGIEAACTLGAMGGDADRIMEVLEAVTPEALERTHRFLAEGRCRAEFLSSPTPLHFIITLRKGDDQVSVEVRRHHTNIVRLERNGEILLDAPDNETDPQRADRSGLSIENIFDFANNVPLADIAPFAQRQIKCNMAISRRGMTGQYGIGIGRAILKTFPDCEITRAKAYTAAASEARMEGCEMPVVIASGSGNQGIASTVPVIVFGQARGISREGVYRALAFSSLLTIYQKEFIGKLSAFCGAVSAS